MGFSKKWIILTLSCVYLFALSSASHSKSSISWQSCENSETSFPLHDAVMAENKEGVLCLLKSGFDPNAQNEYKRSALVMSVSRNLEITKILIEYGADVNLHNGEALAHSISDLGTLISGRNSGDEYFNDGWHLPYTQHESLDEKIKLVLKTIYALLDAGGNYNIVMGADDSSVPGTHIVSFGSDMCYSTGSAFDNYQDYVKYFEKIRNRSQFVIRIGAKDLESINKLKLLSALNLYDRECFDAFIAIFSAGI